MGLPAADVLTVRLVAHVDTDATDEYVASSAAEALALVTAHVGSAAGSIPDEIGMRACLEVGADLYYRRTARNGIVGINSMDVAPVRIQRDPMTAAYPLLTPFLGLGIA